MSGIWIPGDGTLDLDFDRLDIELFGSLPLIGRIDVGILEEDLGEGSEFELAFTCSSTGTGNARRSSRNRNIGSIDFLPVRIES